MLRNLLDLLVLAALWGGSFLFMRVAAPEFGVAVVTPLTAALFYGVGANCEITKHRRRVSVFS